MLTSGEAIKRPFRAEEVIQLLLADIDTAHNIALLYPSQNHLVANLLANRRQGRAGAVDLVNILFQRQVVAGGNARSMDWLSSSSLMRMPAL